MRWGILLLILMLPFAAAQTVYTPSSIEASSDPQFIYVYVNDAVDLYAFDIDMNFTSTIIYNNYSDGGFLSSDGTNTITGEDMGLTEEHSSGIENIIVTRAGALFGLDGSGALFVLSINSSEAGDIIFDSIKFSDSQGNVVDITETSLDIWDTSNTRTVYQYEEIGFYATYEELGVTINGTCLIFGEEMNNTGDQYEFYMNATQTGTFFYNITCDNYFVASDTYTVVDIPCSDGEIRTCGETDVGLCSLGTQECIEGEWTECTGDVYPQTEVCDSQDNDCDGIADEGCDTGDGGGGGGGGGSSGSPVAGSNEEDEESGGSGDEDSSNEECVENWECSSFGECSGGEKLRECVDLNECGSVDSMPELSRTCDTCQDGIKNNGEEMVDCGGPCDPCTSEDKKRFKLTPKNNKLEIEFDNQGEAVRKGVFIRILMKQKDGQSIEEFLGPVTIPEDSIYTESISLPAFGLREDEEYEVYATLSEKGTEVETISSTMEFTNVSFTGFGIRFLIILSFVAAISAAGIMMINKYLR